MSELKPCPFCGGEAKGARAAKAYHVYCTCCGADVMESTMKAMTTCQINTQQFKAEEKWNKRVETEAESSLTAIATKHATLNDERYELLLKQKSDIEMMLDQLFKHENVDGWLVCKMNDMLDDVNHQLDKSRIEAEKGDGICN